MFKSKFFMVMLVLTTLVVAATLVFQLLEMHEYNLFQTLQARFF